MIRSIRLLQNIGQFDSVNAGAEINLRRLVLIYAENGRGKTTLAAVFRSLATGDPLPITERQRLGVQHSPHVVLDCDGGPPPLAMFQNGAWNRCLSEIAVFDDVFIDENVHSGLVVNAQNRQNLHELVLGARGVTLSKQLQDLVSRIEQHIQNLREKSRAIPQTDLQGLSVERFCALSEIRGVDAEIEATNLALAAANDQDAVRNAPLFERIGLPSFDIETINDILGRDLPDLDAAAEARVRAHVEAIGADGEQWIANGVQRVAANPDSRLCPFCAQDLTGSSLLAHFRAYFNEGYADLKRTVTESLEMVRRQHAGDVPAAFERAVRVAGERRQFWSRFCKVPDISIDTAAIMRDWNAARQCVLAALTSKQSALLERLVLAEEARNAIATYDAKRQRIVQISDELTAANQAIQAVQEQAATADPNMIATDLAQLQAAKARHTPAIALLCNEYLAEKEAKARTEEQRTAARAALDQYRTDIFPTSQAAINVYLRRFNAGFRLDSVTSTITRGGAACTYNVVINETAVAVSGGAARQGEPSFRSTLSSGDRNALALAFFFASLHQDPEVGNKVIVIDDPISSLDDHRALTTVQEIRRLAERAGQLIVLSHDKRFLCRVWTGADSGMRVPMEIARGNAGSTLRAWNVTDDSITEHDRRDSQLRDYVANGAGNPRDVARSIRPHLEAFLRVVRPEYFRPGTLLGPFLNLCHQRLHQPDEILDRPATDELAQLVEYANQFHHDTNPAWETTEINDAELRNYVERTLAFAR